MTKSTNQKIDIICPCCDKKMVSVDTNMYVCSKCSVYADTCQCGDIYELLTDHQGECIKCRVHALNTNKAFAERRLKHAEASNELYVRMNNIM